MLVRDTDADEGTMEPRRSRRLAGFGPEYVPEKMEDQKCLICLEEAPGFDILDSSVLLFPCCGKFAHRQCRAQWETTSLTCPHCREFPPSEDYQMNEERPAAPANGLSVRQRA